jgi:hypothetical protein
MQRHARQAKLREVGAAGQARITLARVDVRLDGLAGDVAACYVAGAGVGCVRVRDERVAAIVRAIDPAVCAEVDSTLSADEPASAFDLREPTARAIAQGAHAALLALRAVLEETS